MAIAKTLKSGKIIGAEGFLYFGVKKIVMYR
jgi:hypothetical protein